MGLLDGKTALVTGAGTGIGREAALLLAQDGATVVLTGRRLAPLREVSALIEKKGGKAFTYVLDIESRDEIFATVEWVKNGIGPVDILVNNAGSASKVLNARFLSEEEWNSTVNVNLTAVFNLTQAVLPDMIARGQGTVITVSSLAALNPNLLGGAAYGAAKAGVKNFMTFVHNTYRNQGIRATTILPGETNTPIMNNRARPPLETERAIMLDPHDVARAVHLCASLQNGAVIPELHICPTFMRDTSADIETARWVGAPADTPDLPKTVK
ncbi:MULTISPECIES: SDR family oxidoreductase [Agrobacterium]|uniref:NAD(P)-dependent oxidoreductase n=1 Tax=Agrobacterium rosae TaxID=1972867 RepID=A0AAE5RTJ5_9HYPH|nr:MULTISPECIES: SDR family oxidoreductase [Agrobacterium]KAA3507517.1 SDR family oxidoreductase [Agrobacterium rosae]KAA3511959.1 SDR family oxidoreductase [Agrobacterium rosae]MCM2435521.1 SDR family oxidoreductase [Agrobacterium rosae]MQB51321.1 SDR family oxidoreductase [Agrobacterium rosae]POO48548.1 NAD(P)-dependent oxidoreductase [Agrobacterium rosae]